MWTFPGLPLEPGPRPQLHVAKVRQHYLASIRGRASGLQQYYGTPDPTNKVDACRAFVANEELAVVVGSIPAWPTENFKGFASAGVFCFPESAPTDPARAI